MRIEAEEPERNRANSGRSRQRMAKRKKIAKPESIRAVVGYLHRHPWSTCTEIAHGLDADIKMVRRVIADELSLRTDQRPPATGGPSATLYALPEVPRWYWAWKQARELEAKRAATPKPRGFVACK